MVSISSLCVGAPMLQYAVRFPQDVHGRVNQVGIFQSGWLAGEITRTGSSAGAILFDQLRRAVLAFNYSPDRTNAYGLDGPLLDPVFGTLFLVGLGLRPGGCGDAARRSSTGAHGCLVVGGHAPVFQDHRQTHDVVFLGAPFMYWGFPTMAYLAPDAHGNDVEAPLTEPPPPEWRAKNRGLFVVVLPARIAEVEYLRAAFPDGGVTEIHSEGTAHGLLGSVYEVPPSADPDAPEPHDLTR